MKKIINASTLRVVFLVLAMAMLWQGCVKEETTPFVVVRGSSLRSDVYHLPLDKEKIPDLLNYIKKGGDVKGEGPVDFYNEEFYTGLLEVLTGDKDGDGNYEMGDLFDLKEGIRVLNAESGKYFIMPVIYSIFDSRLKRPSVKSYRPFALADKDTNLWWIFYRQKGDPETVTGVMATVPIYKELDHYKK